MGSFDDASGKITHFMNANGKYNPRKNNSGKKFTNVYLLWS